jgi:hypothetical protein
MPLVPLRQLGDLGFLRGVLVLIEASRRAARTRGFAAPAFAGCAFVEVWRHARGRYYGCQAHWLARQSCPADEVELTASGTAPTALPFRCTLDS